MAWTLFGAAIAAIAGIGILIFARRRALRRRPKMAFSHTAGLDLPLEFDVAVYDALNTSATRLANPNAEDGHSKNVAQIFGAAWNGVAFRLRAAFAYDEEFRASIARSRSPPAAERWAQERALFGCIVSALSSLECFFMATYAIGAVKLSPRFPISKAGHLNRKIEDVHEAFAADYPRDKFSEVLKKVANSPELRDLENDRNVLAHRGIFPRRHFHGGDEHGRSAAPANPKALAVDFEYVARLNEDTTRKHCQWTVTTLNKLMKGLSKFIALHQTA